MKKKKSQEVINVITPEYPKYNPNLKVEQDEIYSENIPSPTNHHSLSGCRDQDEKRKRITLELGNFEKNLEELFHMYYFLKLFSKAALKDEFFNSRIIMLDKYFNKLKKQYDGLKKSNNALKRKKLATDNDVDDLFYKVSDIFDFGFSLKQDLDQLKKEYFPNIKMASYTLCNGKTYQELDKLNTEINSELNEYKSLQEAYDYTCYNSGELITETLEALIAFLKKGLRKNYVASLELNYFIENEVIMYYDYAKWINLMAKINYVTNKCDKSLFEDENFMSKYSQLEKKYLIVLIYNEAMTMEGVI